ncbi:MAG: hypothetical protein COS89_07720, partial [Deltaproteobacteria bacterium CG07_land_8_20_14_0_80_38_7]
NDGAGVLSWATGGGGGYSANCPEASLEQAGIVQFLTFVVPAGGIQITKLGIQRTDGSGGLDSLRCEVFNATTSTILVSTINSYTTISTAVSAGDRIVFRLRNATTTNNPKYVTGWVAWQ